MIDILEKFWVGAVLVFVALILGIMGAAALSWISDTIDNNDSRKTPQYQTCVNNGGAYVRDVSGNTYCVEVGPVIKP